jgi:hypothetical protein
MSVTGAMETLASASPTAAEAVMRRDGSTSVAPTLSADAGSADGVVPEAAAPVAVGSRKFRGGYHGSAVDSRNASGRCCGPSDGQHASSGFPGGPGAETLTGARYVGKPALSSASRCFSRSLSCR